MARKAIITSYDWGQDPGVTISGGSWETQLPAVNMLKLEIQSVAQAVGTSVSFTVNLGATRTIGLIHLQRLVTAAGGTISVTAGAYSSGTVNARPTDLAGVYPPLLNGALGRQRVFIPATPVSVSSVSFTVNAVSTPLQIGYVGICEIFEMPDNMLVGNVRGVLDESDVSSTPNGSTYVTLRTKRRRLDFGMPPLSEATGDAYAVADFSVINGRSLPVVVSKYPDDAYNLERNTVFGLITNDQPITNTFFGYCDSTFQVTQLA